MSKKTEDLNQTNLLDSFDNKQDLAKEYKSAVIERIKDKTSGKGGNTTAESFISWVGGKSRVAKEISAMCARFPHDIYVEPFAGSAAVFFAKAKAKEDNVINDINNNLVNLYRVVRDDLENFLFFIFNTVKSTEQFKEWKKLYKDYKWDELPDHVRAGVWYYLMTNAFNTDETNLSFAYKSSSRGITYGRMHSLIRTAEKLHGVTVLNQDVNKVITKYNKFKNVLFYLDPPYWIANTGVYYKHVFSRKHHEFLKLTLDSVHQRDNWFIISYDDVPEIRELYKNYNIHEIEFQYSMMLEETGTIKNELIITNSNFAKQMDLF
jgi:DNA adenine methylase